MSIYDLIIVGGGVSGLYVNYNFLKSNKNKKTLLIESKSDLGGRIKYNKQYHFESGAARFTDKHIYLNNLIKELKLKDKIIKISNVDEIRLYPNNLYKKELEKYKNIESIYLALMLSEIC